MDYPSQVPPVGVQPEPVLSAPPPLIPVPPSAAPVAASSRRPRQWIRWIVVGVIIAGLIGGGYYAYSRGYLAIPFLTPKEDALFSRFIDSLGEINNAQYTVRAGLKSETRSPGATSVFPSADERKAERNDAKRKSDLASIRSALTLYYDDNGQKYPETIDTSLTQYLSTVPTDPKDQSQYKYQSCDEGKHFLLQTGLESDQYYYLADSGKGGVVDVVPACGQTTNTARSLLRFFRPTAYAQATSFSVESIAPELGLGPAESNYAFLSLLNIFGLGDLESVIDVFPTDIDATAAVTFYGEADKPLKEADASLAISGSYRGDDLTAEFDVEGRKLGSTVYGIIRKFPGIPYLSKYISPIKNTWVKIEPGDGNPFLEADTFKQTSIKSAVESVRQQLQDALKGNIVTVGKTLGTESIAGVQSAHYRVTLHPENVKSVLQKFVTERKAKNLSTTTLEDAIEQLEKPDTLTSLQRLADNSTVDIWVDKVHGFLRQISWSVVLVPPDDSQKLQGKQLRLTLTLTLDKVNQSVNVGRPGDAITYDEAERKVTGITIEQQRFNRQRSQVSAMQSALKQIKNTNGAYPDSIDNLNADFAQAIKTCKAKSDAARNTNTYSYVYCNELMNTPIKVKDVYTDKQYGYVRSGDDFRLTYEMRLNFESAQSDYSDSSSYYKEQYVEGQNTATSKDVSLEKESASEISQKKYQEQVNANRSRSTNANTNTNTVTQVRTIPVVTAAEAVRGDASATYALVEYGDYEGTFVPQFNDTMHQIMDQYAGQVKWVFRQHPLSIYTHDTSASLGGLCVKSLGDGLAFWRYSEALLATLRTTGTLSEAAITSAATDAGIEATAFASCKSSSATTSSLQSLISQGKDAGVTGTPATFLINAQGTVLETISGALPFTTVATTLDKYVTKSATVKDTDLDGLSDDRETYVYRTNPLKSDTDGDTYSDQTEINNGYNPSGDGKASTSQLLWWAKTASTQGAWSACVSLDTVLSCSAYCQSVGKTCTDNGTTSRGYANWGGEAWSTPAQCSAGGPAGGQVKCSASTDANGARWKCFCQ